MKVSSTAILNSSSAFILAVSTGSIAHANGYVAAGMDTTENIVANADSDGSGGGLFAVVVGSDYNYDSSPSNPQLSVGASSVSVRATLSISGTTSTNGTLDVNGGIVGEKFSVANDSGNTSVGGTLNVTNATSLNSTLGVAGAATLSSTLGVAGAATLSSTLGVAGAATLSDTLGVAGAATLSSTLGVAGAATLSDTLGVAGAATLSSTLGVAGAATLSDTLGVAGAATLSSTLGVAGAATLSDKLVVAGATTVSNTFEVDTNGSSTGGTQISALPNSLTMSSASIDIKGDSSTGTNAAITVDGTVTANNTSNIGVLIKGSGQNGVSYDPTTAGGPATWADVSIQSASYGGGDPTRGSAVIVTDFGVRLVSPDPAAGETVYNSQGGNNSAGTVNNSIGLNTGNGIIKNAFGSASTSSGAQSIITNTIGANDGSGAVSTLIGGGTSPTVNTVGNENAETRTILQAGSSSLALEGSSANLRGGSVGNGLNINNTGATFSNALGKPIRVTGVADGTSEFDAVNIGQFGSGMAALSAMNAVPDIRKGDSLSLGFGLGNYMGYNAIAIAGKAYIDEKVTMNFAMATGNRSYEPVYSIGFGASW